MQTEHIEFSGTYRYADPDALDRALTAAREQLDSRPEDVVDWMRCFIRQGSRLWVRAQLPSEADPIFAATLVETLARSAVEGLVEARRGDLALDYFPCGE
ncbi:MAG TPA: hypothetical protein VIV40_10420 [Kofleriaceae bacterium]